MTRVTGIRISSVATELGGRVWNPRIRWSTKHAVFVSLLCEDGRVGLGECWCLDAAPDALIAFLRTEVVPEILGKSRDEMRQAIVELTERATLTARHGMLASAVSGVDLALWDLAAQQMNVPLWRALAADGQGSVNLYASGGLYADNKDVASLADELAGYASRGFSTVKMKIGGLCPDDDAARVAAVRERIGPNISLIVDGVYSYNADDALHMFDRIRHLDILAFQSPIPPEDLAGMRRLVSEAVPVMGVEAEYRPEMFTELIEGRAVAILQVAPIACGGPTRVLDLADRASQFGIPLSLETSSTAVATIAAIHLGAAREEVAHVELHQIHQVFFDQLPLEDGISDLSHWCPPEVPGLGVTLNPKHVNVGFETTVVPARRSTQAISDTSGR